MNNDIQFLSKLIRERRSVYPKDFNAEKKIDDQIVSEILDNAVWAPNHGLNQPWFFKVFHNQGVVTFFNKMKEIYLEITPSDKQNEKKIAKYDEKAGQISHIIAVCMKRDSAKRYPEIEDIVATSCVIQNIYLQLKPQGIAGYLSTGDICYTFQIREFLNLGEDERCMGFFQLGVPSGDIKIPVRKRIPSSEKTEWID